MGTENVDEHTIDVAGAPVFYRGGAADGTTVLCLHSVPTSSDDWLGLLARTGGVAPDLPGFGRSSKAQALRYSLPGYADFLENLIRSLQIDEVSIVGHGWGAAVGLVYAQRHPERVTRLAIVDAVPLIGSFRWPPIARRWRRVGVGELLMGSVGKRTMARALRSGTVAPGAWPPARVDAVWEQFDQGTQRAILRLHRSADPAALAQAGAALETLSQPALIVWGERDPWLAPELAHAYAARLSNSTVTLVPDAGHWPWLDAPAVLDQLAAFVCDPQPQ